MQVTKETDLTPYHEQKVVLKKRVTKDGQPALEELTGTAVAATTGIGVLFKPKGRQQAGIVAVDDIEEIDFAPSEVKPIKPKYVPVVVHGKAREHLVYAHGYGRTGKGNIDEMTEEAALEWHNQMDHGNLGHIHGEKPKAVEAPAEPTA